VKPFVARHPLVFSLLLTLVLFGLLSSAPPCLACNLQCGQPSAGGSRTALGVAISPDPRGERPEPVLGNDCIARLLRARPAKLVALDRLQPAFAVVEHLRLLVLPLLVGTLALLGGVRAADSVLLVAVLLGILLATFGEELIYLGRGAGAPGERQRCPDGVLRRDSPGGTKDLVPEERHRIYKLLRLCVRFRPDWPLEITGVFAEVGDEAERGLSSCKPSSLGV